MNKDDELVRRGAVKRLMEYHLGVVAYQACKVGEAIDKLPAINNKDTEQPSTKTNHPPPRGGQI